MSRPPLYTPVLRWKLGEANAWASLAPGVRRTTRPLVERLPPRDHSGGALHQSSYEFAERIGAGGDSHEILLDSHLMAKDGLPGLRADFLARDARACWDASVNAVPVFGLLNRLDEATAFRTILGRAPERAAIRITLVDLISQKFIGHLTRLLDIIGRPTTDISILIDAQEYHESHGRVESLFEPLTQYADWADLTYLAGAFPASSNFEAHRDYRIHRNELIAWRAATKRLQRSGRLGGHAVGFGDYTSMYAIYAPPPDHCTPAVTAKYTIDERWYVSRGTTLDEGGSEQWIGHAQALTELGFAKAGCCAACDSIVSLAEARDAKVGNFATWIQRSIDHHMTLTSRQVSLDLTPVQLHPSQQSVPAALLQGVENTVRH